MKYKYLTTLFLYVFVFACNTEKGSNESSESTSISLPTNENNGQQIDGLGILLSKINFKIKANKEEEKIYQDSVLSGISIDNPDKKLDRLIDADKIVLPFPSAIIIIDYPLANSIQFEIHSTIKGFSSKQLVKEISIKYHKIYQEEEETASTKTIPIDKREGLINRNETNGKYGISRHDLSDLILNRIEVYKRPDGKIYLILGIES